MDSTSTADDVFCSSVWGLLCLIKTLVDVVGAVTIGRQVEREWLLPARPAPAERAPIALHGEPHVKVRDALSSSDETMRLIAQVPVKIKGSGDGTHLPRT